MAVGALSGQDRAELARAVLAHAELRTGARSTRMGLRAVDLPGGPPATTAAREAGSGPPATTTGPAAAPTEVAAAPSTGPVAVPATVPDYDGSVAGIPAHRATVRPAEPSSPRYAGVLTTERPPLPVPARLSALLPDGLRRGATTAVVGSTSLVLTMLAHACAGGAWAAVVGQPTVGLLAAAQAGVALDRLAVVPRPGADAATVVAALVDGIDVVLVGPDTALTDADRRRLSARARDRGAVLLSSVPWPGAGTVLTVEGGRWSGVGAGDGRLRAHELRVTRSGRGGAAVPLSVDLTLPLSAERGTVPAWTAGTGTSGTGTSAVVTSAAATRAAGDGDDPSVLVVVAGPDLRLVG